MTKDVKNILTVSAVLGALAAAYFFVVQPLLDNNAITGKYKGDDMTNNAPAPYDWTSAKSAVIDLAVDLTPKYVTPDENPKYLGPNDTKMRYL